MKGIYCRNKKCKWNKKIEGKDFGFCELDNIWVDKDAKCEDAEMEP